MTEINEHKLVSFQVLAGYIDYPADFRTLFAEVLRRENRLGFEFIDRQKGPKLTRYKCSVALLREHCPDLVPRRTGQLLAEARQAITEMEENAKSYAQEQVEKLRPRVDKLERGHRDLEQGQEDIADTVSKLTQRVQDIDVRTSKWQAVAPTSKEELRG